MQNKDKDILILPQGQQIVKQSRQKNNIVRVSVITEQAESNIKYYTGICI